MASVLLFYLTAVVVVIATILAISRSNAVHGLLYLVVALLGTALVFFLLGAPFAAALEVIIYAGAIMVLFLFAVRVTSLAGSVVVSGAIAGSVAGIAPALPWVVSATTLSFITCPVVFGSAGTTVEAGPWYGSSGPTLRMVTSSPGLSEDRSTITSARSAHG